MPYLSGPSAEASLSSPDAPAGLIAPRLAPAAGLAPRLPLSLDVGEDVVDDADDDDVEEEEEEEEPEDEDADWLSASLCADEAPWWPLLAAAAPRGWPAHST